MASRDKDKIPKKTGVIYRFESTNANSDEKYIGMLTRTFGKRFKQQFRSPSSIYDHDNTSGYHISVDNLFIVGREHAVLAEPSKMPHTLGLMMNPLIGT